MGILYGIDLMGHLYQSLLDIGSLEKKTRHVLESGSSKAQLCDTGGIITYHSTKHEQSCLMSKHNLRNVLDIEPTS